MAGRNAEREALLKQALASLALEETRQLKDRMMLDPALSEEAEALYWRSRHRVKALIEKKLVRKRRQAWMLLPAAACLTLMLLGVSRLLRAPEDLAVSPHPTILSLTSGPEETASLVPTASPAPSFSPAVTPPPSPAVTPSPSVTSLLSTTPSPSAAPSPSPAPTSLRESWGGRFYPADLPEGFTLSRVGRRDEGGLSHHAEFAGDQGARLSLSEWESAKVITAAPGESGYRYVRLPGGSTALVIEEKGGGARVVWDQDGRTLEVHAESGSADAIDFAGRVRKIQ